MVSVAAGIVTYLNMFSKIKGDIIFNKMDCIVPGFHFQKCRSDIIPAYFEYIVSHDCYRD